MSLGWRLPCVAFLFPYCNEILKLWQQYNWFELGGWSLLLSAQIWLQVYYDHFLLLATDEQKIKKKNPGFWIYIAYILMSLLLKSSFGWLLLIKITYTKLGVSIFLSGFTIHLLSKITFYVCRGDDTISQSTETL